MFPDMGSEGFIQSLLLPHRVILAGSLSPSVPGFLHQ